MSRNFMSLLLAIALCSALAASAQATVITGSYQLNAAYTVFNSDLLQTISGLGVATTGDFTASGAYTGEPALRDGTFSSADCDTTNFAAGGSPSAGSAVTYTLGAGQYGLGYDITEINTYTGWNQGRCGQAYDVSVHLLGSPAGIFVPLASVSYYRNAWDSFPNVPCVSMRVQLSPDVPGGNLAVGVDQVKFDNFLDGGPYSAWWMSYRELDVSGTPTIPEPSTLVLLATGLIGLLCYAWRKRK
ncbi:MAG: PEP-CTERM sorting domain-containing protein [Planctomycetes bacterium]|nr:PEP-CTERM sorting domain-containing protein [Planctomycetota bacterium]MBU4400225.1 PEP-CTERM sorting domain-containing protein [Planctomycetota bacterium]MCG2684493.1 PEP-CTERM sorting domain-containing protein [Planctomycetales bacterium]